MGFGGETHTVKNMGYGCPQSLLPGCEEVLASRWHHRLVREEALEGTGNRSPSPGWHQQPPSPKP